MPRVLADRKCFGEINRPFRPQARVLSNKLYQFPSQKSPISESPLWQTPISHNIASCAAIFLGGYAGQCRPQSLGIVEAKDSYTFLPWTLTIATRYRLDVPGSNPGRGEIFRFRPDRPWGSPSLLYNAYRVPFPGVKRPGRGANHPPPCNAEVKERVELYLYFPSGPSWAVIGRTLPFTFTIKALRCH